MEFCTNCGTAVKKQNIKLFITNYKKILIMVSSIIILAVCAFLIWRIINLKTGTNNDNQNVQGYSQKSDVLNSAKFNNTKDLENFSKNDTSQNGNTVEVNGLDIIFIEALKSKYPDIYLELSTNIGPGDIKGFIINDDIIGGYIIYYNYKKPTYSLDGLGSSLGGYYIQKHSFAIKVKNWNGLDKIRYKSI